ncbi:hypothetical protein TNCV_1055461 [Trichonephila clavipes]|nr:hypothetical protein TNCV_1055461 [Trichonephila clavipes]
MQASHRRWRECRTLTNTPVCPELRLLRRQSSQPGPGRSRRDLRKHYSLYCHRGRSLGRRGHASGPAIYRNKPPNPSPWICCINVLRTSALKCRCSVCWNPIWLEHFAVELYVLTYN